MQSLSPMLDAKISLSSGLPQGRSRQPPPPARPIRQPKTSMNIPRTHKESPNAIRSPKPWTPDRRHGVETIPPLRPQKGTSKRTGRRGEGRRPGALSRTNGINVESKPSIGINVIGGKDHQHHWRRCHNWDGRRICQRCRKQQKPGKRGKPKRGCWEE